MSFFSSNVCAPRPVQTEVEAFWYLNLTPEQQAAYDQLLKHLSETGQLLPGHDDRFTLLRFLKARQWDVHRATTMYQTMVKWRHDYHTDHVYQTFVFPEEDAVLKHYPHFYHNTDKFGRPLYVEMLGTTDAAKILEATTLERLVDYHVCQWENLKRRVLPACSQLAGRPIITKSVILDLKGVSMKTFGTAAQKILRTIVHIDQDYYCESLGQMFIINTPAVFRLIWAAVNPLLEERTRRKIVILGSDYLPTVTQLVPLENLPTCLGGTSPTQQDYKTPVGAWTTVVLSDQLPAGEFPAPVPPGKAGRISTNGAAPPGATGPTSEANGNGNGSCETEPGLTSPGGGVEVKACAGGGPVISLHHSATAPARVGDTDVSEAWIPLSA